MRDLLEQLRMHTWMVVHQRWTALLGAILVCAIGWTALKLTKDTYQVDAKVYLDSKAALQPLFQQGERGGETWSPQQTALLIKRTLLTREGIERIIQGTALKEEVKTPEDLDRMVTSLSERIRVKRLMPAIDEEPSSRYEPTTDIFSVSYQNKDRELALRVVETVLSLFVERFTHLRTAGAQEAAEFLDREIDSYARQLGEAEDRLKQFKLDHPAVLLGQNGQTYSQRVEELQRNLESAKVELREAEYRAQGLRAQIQALSAVRTTTVGGVAGPTALDARIEAAETRLNELLTNYTDQHPDVLGARRALEDLKEQKRKGLDRRASGSVAFAPAPDASAARLMLADAEAKAAALKEKIAVYEHQLADMKPMANKVPAIEAELAKLNRDYDVIKTTYAQLVGRREAIRLAEGVQTDAASMFKVIEAPRLPTLPISPARPLMTSAIFVLAIILGVGVGWLRAQSRPTFYTRTQLASTYGVPVLGSVTMNWSVAELAARQAGFLLFGLATLALVVAYIGMLVYYGLDIGLMLNNLVQSIRALQL